MTETYSGTKFKAIFEEQGKIGDNSINKLIKWGKKFSKLGLTPCWKL